MNTAEELNALREEAEAVTKKLAELSEEELVQISGGFTFGDDGIRLSVGDCFDHPGENIIYRYRVLNPYTVESTLMSVCVRVYAIIGNSTTSLYYGELAVGQLFLMSYVGRYAEDGKTKIE